MSADTFSIVLEGGRAWARNVPARRAITAWRAARAAGVQAEIVRDCDGAQMYVEGDELLLIVNIEEGDNADWIKGTPDNHGEEK